MARNPIDRLIEAKETKIASAERALEKLKIELAVLREARQAVAENAVTVPSAGDADDSALLRAAAELAWRDDGPQIKSPDQKRGRSLSADWKAVLKEIAAKRDIGASLDEIEGFCRSNSIRIKRPTLRAQMSNYVKRGYLGGTGDGRFFIALHGLTVAGLQGPPMPTAEQQVSGESREVDRNPALTGSRGEGR